MKGIDIEERERQAKEFERKRKQFADSFGSNAGFVLATVYGAMETIQALGKEGREVVQVRTGKYRYWDLETIRVDKVAEAYFQQKIDEYFGSKTVIISEEAGRLPAEEEIKFIFVSDPFDGSLLYKKGLPHFWYTSLAMYSSTGAALAAAVCDVTHGIVDFANEEKAYSGIFIEGVLKHVKSIKPTNTTKITDAVLETYLMKVPRLYPACEVWKPLLSQVSFILPNGGPAGYTDVSCGRVDIYLALEESLTENFAALPIAWRSGAIVTNFDGIEVTFKENIDKQYFNIDKRYFMVCSANDVLHEQILSELAKIDWQEHPHYRRILEENKRMGDVSNS